MTERAALDPLGRDREARRLARTELERPLVLEAGAGTGKTTTLVARILAWCLGPGWQRAERRLAEAAPAGATPERVAETVLAGVVAITFTEAAAAQMAARVAGALAELAAGREPKHLDLPSPSAGAAGTLPLFGGQIRETRAGHLLSALDHLTVATIHAWCLRLLSAHPLEAGLHPRLVVDADGRRLDETVTEVVEARLQDAYGPDPDEDYLELAGRGIGPREIAEAVTELVRAGVEAADLEEDPLGARPVAALVARLSRACEELHRVIAPRLVSGSGQLGKAREVERLLARLLPELEQAELPALVARLTDIDPSVRERLKGWRAGRWTGAESRCFIDVAREVADGCRAFLGLLDHVARLDPALLAHARRAVTPLVAEVRERLRARGVVTFQDLLGRTAELLRRERGLTSRLRRGIDQLLVDEFQDTDRMQCEIVGALALDGPAAERPGLFLVGDPKQSIYGWRSADLAIYEEFVKRVEDAGGMRRSLVVNFRSVPPILDEVTRTVAPVMVHERGVQPPFEALLPRAGVAGHAGFTAGGRAAVEHWVSWRRPDDENGAAPALDKTLSADADALEAAAIARDLAALHHEHGVAWGEIALLFRSATSMDTYLGALRRAAVPFDVTGDRHYYRRREVIEAAALVRTVLDPGDHLALLTLLRSVMVGVPDAALVPLWRAGLPRLATELAGGPARLRETLGEIWQAIETAARQVARLVGQVPGLERVRGWDVSAAAAFEALAALRLSWQRDPADRFVEALRRAFATETLEAARFLGSYRLANLERFFRDLGTALEEGKGDETAVLRLLRRAVARGLEEEEGVPPERQDAVQVLTIHKAKGLEFAHVYLPQLHHGPPPPQRAPTEVGRLADGSLELRLLGAATPGFDHVEREREKVEAAERVRLLYVAVTRAEVRVVLLGRWSDGGGDKPVEQAQSFLDLLGHRPDLPGPLAELWRRLAETGGWHEPDPAGALWRFPALAPAAGEPPGMTREDAEAAALEPPERAERGARELAARRRQARREQARPVSRPVSEEAHARLSELVASSFEEDAAEGEALPRDVKMAVGTAIHRALERLDLDLPPEEALAAERVRLAADLALLLPPERLPAAESTAVELWQSFGASPLCTRLYELAPHLVARELPVLLPPHDGAEAPAGFSAGAVDLLYRDPRTGEPVVADFKTDEVAGDEELAERARAYTPQGWAYARAVAQALRLGRTPRFELWFLRAGRIEIGG